MFLLLIMNMFDHIQSLVEKNIQCLKQGVSLKPENNSIITEISTPKVKINIKPEICNSDLKIKIKLKPPPPKPEVKLPKLDQSVWAEKYRPITLDKIVGNTEQIAKIRQWFKDFIGKGCGNETVKGKGKRNENETVKEKGKGNENETITGKGIKSKTKKEKDDDNIPLGLLLIGGPGTSKTSIAHAVLREFGYDVMEYNASDIRSSSQLESSLDKIISNYRIEQNACPFGIVMDEIDGMSTGDKGGMSHLIKIITSSKNKNHNIPIICICNNYGDKKVSLLRKVCQEVFFNRPTVSELVRVIENVSACEGFVVEQSCAFKIAGIAQGDFRRLMYMLQSVYSLWMNNNVDRNNQLNNIITSDIIFQNLDLLNEKFIALDSKQITSQIFGKLLSNDDIYRLYELEKSSIPMLVFENYVDLVDVQSTKISNKIDNCKSFIDAIILSDKIEKTMFTSQSWYLQQVHCLASCYMPNYYSNKYTYVHLPNIKWTTTLRKYSQQKSTIKNINALSILFNKSVSHSVDDVQTIAELILFNLLHVNGDQREGIKMLKEYNLNVDDIEKLVRTDQLVGYYKNIYKSKHKTLLTKLYGEMFPESSTIETGISKSKKQSVSDRLGKLRFSSKREKEEKEKEEIKKPGNKRGYKPKLTIKPTTNITKKFVEDEENKDEEGNEDDYVEEIESSESENSDEEDIF